MNIKEWAEKFAASIHEWVTSVEENLNVDLGDVDEED
jgi:hypothetical protein